MQCGGSPTIYGWRKRCLYALVLGLLVVVLCNFVATLLILNAINFNLVSNIVTNECCRASEGKDT